MTGVSIQCWHCGNNHFKVDCPVLSFQEREEEMRRYFSSLRRQGKTYDETQYRKEHNLTPADDKPRPIVLAIQTRRSDVQEIQRKGKYWDRYCMWCHASGHDTNDCNIYCPYCEKFVHAWWNCTDARFKGEREQRTSYFAKRKNAGAKNV
jgi:hypothetical protein